MVIFFGWLECFNAFISRTPNRKILLLLRKFLRDGSLERLPYFPAVEVKFLSVSITSRLQPIDSRIIASLKQRYRTVLYNRILDKIESEDNVYKIDQLTAMRYMRSVWLDMRVVHNIVHPVRQEHRSRSGTIHMACIVIYSTY